MTTAAVALVNVVHVKRGSAMSGCRLRPFAYVDPRRSVPLDDCSMDRIGLHARWNMMVQITARDGSVPTSSIGTPSIAISASTPRRSHSGGLDLVEQRYIVSQQVEDVGCVGATGTRAFVVGSPADLVPERPSHSASDGTSGDLHGLSRPFAGHRRKRGEVADEMRLVWALVRACNLFSL